MAKGYIGTRLGQCSCFGVGPILWGSDERIDFLERLWTACCMERWMKGGAFRGGVWGYEGDEREV